MSSDQPPSSDLPHGSSSDRPQVPSPDRTQDPSPDRTQDPSPDPDNQRLPYAEPVELQEPGEFLEPVTVAEFADDVELPATPALMDPIPPSKLSYLHPSSLVFDLLAHGKTYLVPAAFGLLGAAKGDLTLLIISGMIFVPAVLVSVFRYFTLRYIIQDGQLVVTQGLVFRNVRTVPISKIQNIDYVQNPLHRILKVAEVKVETASGTKPEATLRVLSMPQMEKLRDAVMVRQAIASPDSVAGLESDSSDGSPTMSEFGQSARGDSRSDTVLAIPSGWLVKAGLASNRGMIMVGVLLGAYYQFGATNPSVAGRFGGRNLIQFNWLHDLFPSGTPIWAIVLTSLSALVGALLFFRILGIAWFLLRFQGYRLMRRGDDLRISCGLLTKVSATIPRQRVQFISIHRNVIMRLFKLASIRIETAGGAGKGNENATETVSKRWFVPVIPEAQVSHVLKTLRPELDWDEASLDFRPLAPKAGRRLARLAIFQSFLFCGLGLIGTRPWGFLLGFAVLPLFLIWAKKKSRAMRYARTQNGVVYRSGVFNRKTSITFFEKIQALRVDQTPLDRRWKMAKLSVDTAAAGPADHRIEVPFLDEQFAREELQLLRIKTGKEQPVFG